MGSWSCYGYIHKFSLSITPIWRSSCPPYTTIPSCTLIGTPWIFHPVLTVILPCTVIWNVWVHSKYRWCKGFNIEHDDFQMCMNRCTASASCWSTAANIRMLASCGLCLQHIYKVNCVNIDKLQYPYSKLMLLIDCSLSTYTYCLILVWDINLKAISQLDSETKYKLLCFLQEWC